MGVAETHQVLVRNELRERVVLRADGGFRSGRDVLVAAALGADEYGFGTVAMIATGCIMARVCHTNNCPVGVASQREELRARFPGAPGDLVNFFHFVAEEVGGFGGGGRGVEAGGQGGKGYAVVLGGMQAARRVGRVLWVAQCGLHRPWRAPQAR